LKLRFHRDTSIEEAQKKEPELGSTVVGPMGPREFESHWDSGKKVSDVEGVEINRPFKEKNETRC
jgi:hypothetical protein